MKSIPLAGFAFFALIINATGQSWTDWQTLNDGRSNLIDISYSIGGYDYGNNNTMFNFRVRNRYSQEVTVTVEIECIASGQRETRNLRATIAASSINSDPGNHEIITKVLSYRISKLDVGPPKLGDYEKELVFPDAPTGDWILFNNAIIRCANTSLNQSEPCPVGECATLSISRNGAIYTLDWSNAPTATYTNHGNVFTNSGGGKMTYYISNDDVLTMTTNIPQRGSGCQFEYKFRRNN